MAFLFRWDERQDVVLFRMARSIEAEMGTELFTY